MRDNEFTKYWDGQATESTGTIDAAAKTPRLWARAQAGNRVDLFRMRTKI